MTEKTCGSIDQGEELQNQLNQALNQLDQIRNTRHTIADPDSLQSVERVILQATDKIAALMTGLKIQQAVDSNELREKADELVRAMPEKLKNQGWRLVSIQTSRGTAVKVAAPYFSRRKKDNRNKKKKIAFHATSFHPALLLVGVYDRGTPLLSSEISILAAMLSSFDEVSRVFADKGVSIGINAIRRIAQRFASRAKIAQRLETVALTDSVGHRRVVVSTDGGRLRLRKYKRGPRTKKGRRRYQARWTEPKLIIIYAVDDQGKMDRCFIPVIEGTLKGPDIAFGLLHYYLQQLDVSTAEKVLFVADGARWIWSRISALIDSLGLAGSKVYELVDFYHAVEHLAKVADLKKNWKRSEKRKWIQKHRRMLLNGRTDQVIAAIKIFCRGRNSKNITTERNYFIRNQHRMNYQRIADLNLPLGSGAMESAIRRVVNLRLKGASIYWLEQTAEAMLMLRSYYKSGRWNLLKNLSFSLYL